MSTGAAARAAVACATALLLASCATAPLTPAPLTWEARASRLATLPAWQARGRVAVATAREGFSGSFDWRERVDRSDITVRGPVGIGGVSITREDREVRIATSKGEVFMSQAPDQDLEARLGAPLPISYLRYWMTGQPAPLPAPQPAPGSVCVA